MVPVDRLERYWDFVAPERSGQPFDPTYRYNPRLGLQRILSCLTPDAKALAVTAMGETTYFTQAELYRGVNEWLKAQGARTMPIESRGVWTYVQFKDSNKNVVDGSLVEIGAVVKETHYLTGQGYQTGYSRSLAGKELVVPLVRAASDFVFQAKSFIPTETTPKPKYTSMTRVLGGVNSPIPDRHQQLFVFDVVEFLVKNGGVYRKADLMDKFPEYDVSSFTRILANLGLCGVIRYEAPTREELGIRQSGWSGYVVKDRDLLKADITLLYRAIKKSYPSFRPRGFKKAVEYIRENPDDNHNRHSLSSATGVKPEVTSMILSALKTIRVLRAPEEGFQAREASKAEANDITHFLYNLVLEPALKTAENLAPQSLKAWNISGLDFFLDNYDQERNRKGPGAAQQTRDLILALLNTETKLSDLIQKHNNGSDRELGEGAISYNLRVLMATGQVIQPKPGYYQATQRLNKQ